MAKSAAALVVAAGRGTRLADPSRSGPKQYMPIGDRPVLTHTLNALGNHPRISKILTVIHPEDATLYTQAIATADTALRSRLLDPVFGGSSRQKSVYEGLKALEKSGCHYVLIHDAARPFVTHAIVDRLIETLDAGSDGVLAAIEVADTLKKFSGAGQPLGTLDRKDLWAAQTPQAFAFSPILRAHEVEAKAGRHDFTDDTSLAEANGLTIELCPGDPANFKITTAADLRRADAQARQNMTENLSAPKNASRLPQLSQLADIRTGIGYDVHAFGDGEKVVLGGIEIPHTQSLQGHSDADVVLHAITDATLGAIGDGDIGQHFPPSDERWKGASSDRFQQDAARRVAQLGGRIAHIDVTIVCEEPKIKPHREAIRTSVGRICALPLARVSIKATTSERLGFTGRKEGIAALACVTVRLPLKEEE